MALMKSYDKGGAMGGEDRYYYIIYIIKTRGIRQIDQTRVRLFHCHVERFRQFWLVSF